MRLTRLILLVVLLCITPAFVYSQCSKVFIEGVTEVEYGEPVTVVAKFDPPVPAADPTFKWHINIGTIAKGDNTSSITIDTTGLGGQRITVSVEVKGTVTTCADKTEFFIDVQPIRDCCFKFDEYGDLKYADEKARLDNFAIAILNFNNSVGHIVAYAGKKTYVNEASDRLARAKDYLVKVRRIQPNRIVTIDGGYGGDFRMSLWVLPGGVTLPMDPRSAQIAPDQLDFSKPRPRTTKKRKSRK
jgi:hypothetical protein